MLPCIWIGSRRQCRLLLQNAGLYLRQLGLPAWLNALEHAGACGLVNADQHRLARLPARRAVLDEVIGQLVHPVTSGDHLLILTEQLLQYYRLAWIDVPLLCLLSESV